MNDATLDIVGWSAISPFGIGRAVFADGVRDGRATSAPIDPDRWRAPVDRACLVPDFDVRTTLGTRGTRVMNRVTGLAVGTVGDLLRQAGGSTPAEEIGLVLGTALGSAQSSIDFTRGSLTAAEPFGVESGLIPYAVMNGAAGQCAIWHDLKGPNAPLAAGRAAGLLALNYARRLLLTGRARTVLAGSAEEYSEARAWLAQANGHPVSALGEGCAMFALTTQRTAAPIATLVGIKAMCCSTGDWAGVIRACVAKVLAAGGIEPEQIWAAAPSGAAGEAGAAEHAVLADLLPNKALLAPVTELVGEADAASGSFQLAAVLSLAESDPAAAGRFALITSVDDGGSVVAALVRLPR
ncbi:MAG: hypothetical protein JWQ81_2523 [Amycolatopsis sp.]|uniref:beta-ketoacyl synthase N-terminal-like domain-containing protein n=1 Tax=Amycolatopsis sp. TaxID=37632 RepID=UPI0026037510|nr:beta-ketoacyl synthase N-terminal-like domain-containing protein [Amycolatopsis sp.]MCU1681784.1 hypothetical protein [Amycolatopsis sp.]